MFGRALEPWHVIVLLIVVVVLFGGKRLPDAARGVGKSLRILKAEVREMKDDAPGTAAGSSSTSAAPAAPAPVREPEAVEGRIVSREPNDQTADQRRDA